VGRTACKPAGNCGSGQLAAPAIHKKTLKTLQKRHFATLAQKSAPIFSVWHTPCIWKDPEVIGGVVGPAGCINSAGVKGGEGQESRLFSLTWVRGPSGKLLPRSLLADFAVERGKALSLSPFFLR